MQGVQSRTSFSNPTELTMSTDNSQTTEARKRKPAASADNLTRTQSSDTIELTEVELRKVQGGAMEFINYSKIDPRR